MGVWQSMAISESGMRIEQLRAETAARNIARANVPLAAGVTPRGPLRVVARADGLAFGRLLQAERQGMADGLVRGQVVESADRGPRRVLDPGHPLADEHGFVAYPGIRTLDEMFVLTLATRAYEANVVAFNAARTMALRALDIGGR
ncbi:flagellar basal body rod protein FlgC [Microvirgula curvata]|uniref:Flagellar basal body rod protein FlgC n=2 Tax=Microvirgula TaxID=57479 RepID=A0A2S0PCW2_9NEIS|nr:flagellar basal body rod protein FlgC [Microvirgula aerodenitrificans]AVY95172.1 flagellar basal body rod protein FlgC [Microvirgula aerodenitrificans]RAS15078.1 flagellar basal-body rod protein FlgC [Microvirgula sp. AG722]